MEAIIKLEKVWKIYQMGGMSAVLSIDLLAFSLLISTSIGIIAGIAPTYMASKLQPVDALRYE